MRVYRVTANKSGVRWGVDYVDDQGRRVRKVVADTKRKAEAYLARVRVDLERGTYHDPGRYTLTLGELVPMVEAEQRKTTKHKAALVRRVVRELGPTRQARTLRIADWEALRDRLEAGGAVKPASRNRYLSALRSALRAAVKRGLLREDPLRHAAPERENNQRNRIAPEEEEARLWAACLGQEDRTLLALALYTAARRGEIHRATFADFDAKTRTWWLPVTKSGKPRTLPLHDVALHEVWALQMARGAKPSDRLYPGKHANSLSERFARMRTRAGLVDIGLHDLRRTAATRAVVAGVPLPTVMAVLGHTSLASTSRYIAITAEHSRPFAEALPARPPRIPNDNS